jgi:hypothetical protein
MRRLALVLCFAVVLVAAGCGGGKTGPSNSVLETSKAFSDAGLPFTTEVTSNPYVRGQQVYLPGKLNGTALQDHVLAFLSGSRASTHAGWFAWVFDSNASADDAVKQLPLDQWGTTSGVTFTHAQKRNVILVGAGFAGADATQLNTAIAALR